MTQTLNSLGQPVGFDISGWTPPQRPPRESMVGLYCRVEPLDKSRHAADLYRANRQDPDNRIWTYLAYGPFDSLESYHVWMDRLCCGDDPLFHAIVDAKTDKAVGVATYLRIDPANGSIEVGHINYSPLLQRTPAATEAMYLMMKRAFDLGYRRSACHLKASFGKPAPTRAEIATRLGTRRSIRSGRHCRPRFGDGLIRQTSTQRVSSELAWRI